MCLGSDFLNMNDTEFTFVGLIKSNDEGLFLGMNPSFLRFIKHMRMDSSLDELYRLFVTLFKLVKSKEVLILRDEEIKGMGNIFHLY